MILFQNIKEKVRLIDLKRIINKLENLPVIVPFITILQKKICDVEAWIKETSDTFIKDSSKLSLIEVFCICIPKFIILNYLGTLS